MTYFDAAWLSLISPVHVQGWVLRLNVRERFIIIYILVGVFLPLMILAGTTAEALLLGEDILLLGVQNTVGATSFLVFFYLLSSLQFSISHQRQPGLPLFLLYFIPVFFPLVVFLPAALLFILLPHKSIVIIFGSVAALWFVVRLYLTLMRYSGIYASGSFIVPVLMALLALVFFCRVNRYGGTPHE